MTEDEIYRVLCENDVIYSGGECYVRELIKVLMNNFEIKLKLTNVSDDSLGRLV